MIKQAQYTYKGMNQDLSKSKRGPELYFKGNNIRITSNSEDSTGSVTAEKGNTKVVEVDTGQTIIGTISLNDYIILFSTNDVGTDYIYRVDTSDYSYITLITGDLNFSTDNYISAISNYENEDLQKVYWVDGKNQYRFINIITPTTDINLLDIVPSFTISQPVVESTSIGGTHTAGKIQYAYNLAIENGQQTKLSPISPLVKLQTISGDGGELNEIVSQTNNILIENVDTSYDLIYLYSIKYTSYNTTPTVSLIANEYISSSTFRYSDDGSTEYDISLSTLLFMGGTPLIPGSIESVKNRTILGNITESYFDINLDLDITDSSYFDTRAYRFKYGSLETPLSNSNAIASTVKYNMSDGFNIDNKAIEIDHDCINTDFDTYNNKYLGSEDTVGATGNDLEIEIIPIESSVKDNVLKDNEIYRYAIEFYNDKGQCSPASWICDLKTPQQNLTENISNGLKITINPDSISKLINQGVVGWRVLRVERLSSDKTRLDQGILGSSCFQILTEDEIKDCQYEKIYKPSIDIEDKLTEDQLTLVAGRPKTPTPLFRTNKDLAEFAVIDSGLTVSIGTHDSVNVQLNKLNNNHIINYNSMQLKDYLNESTAEGTLAYSEVFSTRATRGSGDDGKYNKQVTVQNNKLLQMYSPECVISQKETQGVTGYVPIATFTNTIANCNIWGKKYDTDTQLVEEESTKNGGISMYDTDSTFGRELIEGHDGVLFNQNGLIGPSGDETTYLEYQYGRVFSFDSYVSSDLQTTRTFLDETPMYVGMGEKNKVYSTSSKYKFNNHLGNIITEKNKMDNNCEILASVNSVGNNCYLFVDGTEEPLETILEGLIITHEGRRTVVNTNADALLVELTRTLSNQYGGNTHEARSNNDYLRIGNYVSLYDSDKNVVTSSTNTIANAGDVFVNVFRFERIVPNSSKVYSAKYTSMCEILEFPVESSIDLAARNDDSSGGWNSTFHPSYSDYHSYNEVYSQEPISTTNATNSFTFKAVEKFNNKVTTTKAKNAGDLIDGWTDILVNEEILLDGKYGRLNELINLNGTIYAFQDKAIAVLQIQPRIQQVTSDGVGLELGTGDILYDSIYFTTESGSVNSRSIFKSANSIYFLDLYNKSFNKISKEGLDGLSTTRGMQSYFIKNLDINELKFSNKVHGGFNYLTDDAYLTVKDEFTISFNERTDNFVSFYGFNAANLYLKDKATFYSCNNSNGLYSHNTNDFGVFYDKDPEDSSITLLCAPNSFGESLFYSLEFMAELRDSDDNDVFYDGTNYTIPIKSIQALNDYQDTTTISLSYKANIFRRFRNWAIQIPKDSVKKHDFIRGKWAKIKLTIDNSKNNTLILHDIILNYNEQIPLH